MIRNGFVIGLGVVLLPTLAYSDSYDWGRKAIRQMAGCFQVDYSFSEVAALHVGYQLDPRVYDATEKNPVKEYVMLLEDEPNRLVLQRLLFAENARGDVIFKMKHFGEIWTYEKPWLYRYEGDGRWNPESIYEPKGTWTREVTGLDDGPRYQCASAWTKDGRYPEWRCDGFAPIPGRETRDMGRSDYHELDRKTRLISYDWGYLDRQDNKKVRLENSVRTELAREKAKTFNIQIPTHDCSPVSEWAEKRQNFWKLTRQVWQEDVLNGEQVHASHEKIAGVPRYAKIAEVEEEFFANLDSVESWQMAKDKVRKLIADYKKD